MSDRGQWPLQKIRESYLDVVDLYNDLFPLRPGRKSGTEEDPNFFDLEEDPAILAVPGKEGEMGPKLEEAAGLSQNCQIWRRGESLQGLNESLRHRIARALEFGV